MSYFNKQTDTLYLKPNENIIVGNPYDKENSESHQIKVICYCRTEDDAYVKMVEVDLITGETKMTLIKNDESNNPSSRRQAVSIVIEPEGMSPPFNLNILQHKGNTYITTTTN